jgi:hypothetical protein
MENENASSDNLQISLPDFHFTCHRLGTVKERFLLTAHAEHHFGERNSIKLKNLETLKWWQSAIRTRNISLLYRRIKQQLSLQENPRDVQLQILEALQFVTPCTSVWKQYMTSAKQRPFIRNLSKKKLE